MQSGYKNSELKPGESGFRPPPPPPIKNNT